MGPAKGRSEGRRRQGLAGLPHPQISGVGASLETRKGQQAVRFRCMASMGPGLVAVTKSTNNAIITGVQRKFALKWMYNEAPSKQASKQVAAQRSAAGWPACFAGGTDASKQKQRAVPSSKAPTTSMLLSADPWPIGRTTELEKALISRPHGMDGRSLTPTGCEISFRSTFFPPGS